MMTGEAQQAALKMTEDPPNHVYFMFATTHPNKIIPTLRGRCEAFELKTINAKVMEKLVQDVATKEKIKISKDVLEGIVKVASGSAREALVMLGKVATLDNEDERLSVLVPPATEAAAFDLVKVLMPFAGKPKWVEVADVLAKVLETEKAEGLRQLVISIARKALLDPKKPARHAAANIVIQQLRDPFYDAENAASAIFAACCYEICVLIK
jgi:DNA polymerase III gamma/tau subunit